MSHSADIFLSYSREDQATARQFALNLEAQGFTVWWDATLRMGESFDRAIEKALNEAKAVVVLWSKNSVDSRWVRAEATMADRNGTLAPVMIEACQRPIIFELTHTADLSDWTGDVKDQRWRTFVADVRQLVARDRASSAVSPTNSLPTRPTALIPWYRRWKGRIAIIALPLLVATAVLYGELHAPAKVVRSNASEPPTLPVANSVAPADGAVSLAVLPFLNISADPNQEYFSDGLTEELLNQLAQIRDVRVAGRTSSFSFKGKAEDLRVIGHKLGVNHILEGSVRKDGGNLRIYAELISTADGTRIWGRTYDRKLTGVFAVQEDIATDVAGALRVVFGNGEVTAGPGATTNVDAYDKFLRAQALADKGGPEDIRQAIALYRAALSLDPSFARAWYGLYTALVTSVGYARDNVAAIQEQMAHASKQASALAPNAWWTHAMLAEQLLARHQWSNAESAALAALNSAPASEPNAAMAYALFLQEVGRVREACPYFKRARDDDPLSLRISGAFQSCLWIAGRSAEAETEYDRSKDLSGDHTEFDWDDMIRLWAQEDADPVAINARFRAFVAHENVPMALNHALVGKLQDKQAALAAIREAFNGPASQRDWPRVSILAFYADHFGDKGLALAAMRRRIELHGDHHFGWFPFETHLRADPRFKQIMRDLKLYEYWRTSGKWSDFCHPVGADDFECE